MLCVCARARAAALFEIETDRQRKKIAIVWPPMEQYLHSRNKYGVPALSVHQKSSFLPAPRVSRADASSHTSLSPHAPSAPASKPLLAAASPAPLPPPAASPRPRATGMGIDPCGAGAGADEKYGCSSACTRTSRTHDRQTHTHTHTAAQAAPLTQSCFTPSEHSTAPLQALGSTHARARARACVRTHLHSADAGLRVQRQHLSQQVNGVGRGGREHALQAHAGHWHKLAVRGQR